MAALPNDHASKRLMNLLCKAAGVDLPNVTRIECVCDVKDIARFTVTLNRDAESVKQALDGEQEDE